MLKLTSHTAIILGILMFVLAFAMVPAVLQQSYADGSLQFLWSEGLTRLVSYIGVTLMVFSNAYAYEGYQYNLVVNGIFTMLLLYVILFAILRALLYGWEKVFAR